MVTKIHEKNNKTIAKTKKISYTKIIEKKEKTKGGSHGKNKRWNPWKTRERERESLNIEDKGFNSIAKKLYIKYQNLKINLTETRSPTSDIGYPTSAKLIFK